MLNESEASTETPNGKSSSSSLIPWRIPQPFCSSLEILDKMYPLLVYNSLTRTKVRFIPKDGKTITWYQCGPTVYAESHMGHARTYVSLDIIRRIMKDYLGYNILLCQNVTDIDDKIIVRSSENNIPFRDLASKYEKEFNEDMISLGCLSPDIVTRVSEYVEEIVTYISELINKGVAYESNGSVYFSVSSFEMNSKHKYGKLMPEQIGNSELLAEGEGSGAGAKEEKRSSSDFALWKRTKEVNEPFWDSPWGRGRPGWHIECSVMSYNAMKKFGGGLLDVHAGGVDLKFPHHDNEIAQSEAFLGHHQWVNYWLHTGHLNIKGFKMSKSLKNFISIRSALQIHSSRQIRFCFLLHRYNATMDYGDATMSQAVNIEKVFSEFFHNVKAALRRLGGSTAAVQHVGVFEEELLQHLERIKMEVRTCLLDDFDTPGALQHLSELVRETHRYLDQSSSSSTSSVVLTSVAKYITNMFRIFGVVGGGGGGGGGDEIGFPLNDNEVGVDREQLLTPYLDVLCKFREVIRIAAMSKDCEEVLRETDRLRDLFMPDLGVRMEDKGSGISSTTVWKLDDVEVLKREKQLRIDEKMSKDLQKEEIIKKQKEKDEKAKIDPKDLFRTDSNYSSFDNETGLPTLDKDGQPLSKALVKKLQKEIIKQTELHEKYLKSIGR